MQKFLSFFFLCLLATLCCGSASSDCITKDGYFRGVKLAGCARIVGTGEDFKVRIVTSAEDLRVRVDDTATRSSKPGHWRFVGAGGDFKVRFVNSGEDFSIRFDQTFAGVRNPCR